MSSVSVCLSFSKLGHVLTVFGKLPPRPDSHSVITVCFEHSSFAAVPNMAWFRASFFAWTITDMHHRSPDWVAWNKAHFSCLQNITHPSNPVWLSSKWDDHGIKCSCHPRAISFSFECSVTEPQIWSATVIGIVFGCLLHACVHCSHECIFVFLWKRSPNIWIDFGSVPQLLESPEKLWGKMYRECHGIEKKLGVLESSCQREKSLGTILGIKIMKGLCLWAAFDAAIIYRL